MYFFLLAGHCVFFSAHHRPGQRVMAVMGDEWDQPRTAPCGAPLIIFNLAAMPQRETVLTPPLPFAFFSVVTGK